MSSILLAILLLQAAPQNVGAVTGVVRGANGMPAAGVRVYAIAVRDTAEAASSAAPLESQAQTDSGGRYRLEVSPGRYYIASGSVNAPTYYPGTMDLAGARAVAVVSGGLVDAIDFSSFIPATRALTGAIIQGTGFISGVIRFPDGSPAAGITVSAAPVFVVMRGPSGFPASSRPIVVSRSPELVAPGPTPLPPLPVAPQPPIVVASGAPRWTVSDATGAYVLQNLAPDSYYIAAGFAEAPTLYPGVTDILTARPIVTTPMTNLMAIDFIVARPPPTLMLSGRVFGIADGNTDALAAGAMLEIKSTSPMVSSAYGLPASSAPNIAFAGPDGKFQFSVRSGTYTLSASFSGIRTEARSVVVADQPLSGLDFSIPLAALSGRIVAEDGTAFPNARLFEDVIVTTADNPYLLASTILRIADDGRFSRLLEGGTYRFRLRTLPEEYSIKSVVAGGVDLLKETLKLSGKEPVSVEVRVAKRTPSPDPGAVSVRGRVLDAVAGTPSAASRITLCCRDSELIERFSAPINTDGSFEFGAVPRAHYAVGLQPKGGNLFVVGRDIDVGTVASSTFELASTPQFGELAATIALEGAGTLALDSGVSVVFTSSSGRVRVVSRRGPDGTFTASVPVGDRYDVSVMDLPQGYAVKSVSGSTEVRPASTPLVGAPLPSTPIVITLTPVR